MNVNVLSVSEEEGMAKDALGVISSGLMEAIHVELANEAVDLVVAEIAGKNNLLELVDILDDELNP